MRLSDFEEVEKIGEGTFGKVYKGFYRDPMTGEKKLYALKKLNMMEETEGFPLTALREIKYLKQMNHANVMRLKQIIYSKRKCFLLLTDFIATAKTKDRGSFYLVFDYMNFDL
jgi:cyclin-dependent kinase 12/13